jgi:dTDP-glucose 4,6-dehydratase
MRIAVLGQGSCFAINLSKHLVARGDEVLGISRSPLRDPAFTLGLESHPRFKYQQAHLVLDMDKLFPFLDAFEPQVIVNFAALCEVGLSWDHPASYYETNCMAMVKLTGWLSRRPWLRKFIQIGSSEVYGSVTEPATEEAPYRPSSPYAASKAVFDWHLKAISKHQGFPMNIVMPSNGYCEGQTLNRIIPKAIIAAITGTKLKLQGGGMAQKSYLHADDISKAIMLVMDKGKLGEVYNCGPDFATAIKTVVALTAHLCGSSLERVAEIAPERTGQDMCYLLDSSKIKALGWEHKIYLKEGIQRVINWIENNPELKTMDQTYHHRP